MEKAIGRSVARVVVRNRVVILIQTQVIHIEAEIDIEASIAVVVGHGGVGERSLWRSGKLERVPLQGKRSVALIEEEQGSGAAHNQQILPAPVQEIDKECACGAVEHANARLVSNVFKRAIPTIAIQAVGQTVGLADVQIIESVVVEIARRYSVVAVDIHPNRTVENGSPIIRPVQD